MTNIKKQTILGAKIWVWEGDLVPVDNGKGIVPKTFICVRLKDDPDEQVWLYKNYYLAEWGEDSYVASSRPREIIEEIKGKGHINLMDDWYTDPGLCINGNAAERKAIIQALQEQQPNDGIPF